MSDLEEAIKRKYLLVDSWDVRHQHVLIIGFSILMFIIYAIFLWILFSTTPSVMTSILLLGSQIGLGLPAARAYYDFGLSARTMLRFYDSSVLGSNLATEDLSVNIGDISLVFERMSLQLQKYDAGTMDDLNDLAWFAIIIWSMISSFFFFKDFGSLLISLSGAVVLVVSCLASYISGFRTVRGISFEEDFGHLEFFVEKHVRNIDGALPSANGVVIFQLIKRRRKYALVDVVVEFRLQENMVLEYHLGLSSMRNERFIINAPQDVIDSIYGNLKELTVIQYPDWILEQVTTQSGRILRFLNQKKILNIADNSTFIISPTIVEKSALEASYILKTIFELL